MLEYERPITVHLRSSPAECLLEPGYSSLRTRDYQSESARNHQEQRLK